MYRRQIAMTTTPTPIEAPKLVPYPEDDKLGPLGGRPSSLHDPIELRAQLAGAFHDAVAEARAAVGEVETHSSRAVHETRKALRRARAVLALISDALPKSERRAVRRALQEARRSLSTVRDHAVAPKALGEQALGEDDRETARRVVDNAAAAIPAVAEIKQLIAEAAARAAAQAEAIETALPPEVTWDSVLRGIGDVYGQARRARRLAKGSRQWFHTWRRRSKELVYQLDFIARHAGPRTLAIRAELDGIADTMGGAVDLLMVREFVATHGQGLARDAVEHLRRTLEIQLDEQMKLARKAGGDVFELKAKKFERRLAKAVKRDLAPADANGHNE